MAETWRDVGTAAHEEPAEPVPGEGAGLDLGGEGAAWGDEGRPTPEFPLPPGEAPVDLLVWDAPNVDATLSQVIGAKPTAANRPRYDAIARWLVDTAGTDHEVEGAVFANVPPAAAHGMRGWVEAVRAIGFAVFALPKLHDKDDVDLDMLAHVRHRAASGRLARLVVASGDGRNFLAPLEQLAQQGVDVTVLSFFEVAGYAAESPHLRFLDLEEVPGAFLQPLDRTRLDTLPENGAWLRPTRSLRDAVGG